MEVAKDQRQKKIKQQNRQMRKIHKSILWQLTSIVAGKTFKGTSLDGGITVLSIFGIICVVRDVTYRNRIRNVLCLASIIIFVFGAHTLSRVFQNGFIIKAQYKDFFKAFTYKWTPGLLLHLLVGG